jgi:hypothetical protein
MSRHVWLRLWLVLYAFVFIAWGVLGFRAPSGEIVQATFALAAGLVALARILVIGRATKASDAILEYGQYGFGLVAVLIGLIEKFGWAAS